MMKVIMTAGVASVVLGGCASLQMNPEYGGLPEVGQSATTQTTTPPPPLRTLAAIKAPGTKEAGQRIGYELQRVALSANNYLAVGKDLSQEDRGAGALRLGSGFYGAAVTAFNPAPKNLLAALLAGGTGQAWSSALKPAARATVYVRGYRALDCVYSAGSALLEEADKDEVAGLRAQVQAWAEKADEIRWKTPPGSADKDLATLAELVKKLQELDAALRLEQASIVDGPYRVARVRREIEAAVDKRITDSAPDYAAALKLITDAAKPAAAPPPTKAITREMMLASGFQLPPDTLPEMLRQLPDMLVRWKSKASTQAADAYERMGKCIELV